jgi:CRP-like cAMP-binding protein
MAKSPSPRASRPSARPGNRILASLPVADYQRLLPDLTTVPAKVKQVFHRQGEPLTHVFFPNGGMASMTIVLSNGTMIEAGTVGDEGVLGIEAAFTDAPVSQGTTLLQVPDTSLERLSVAAFRAELNRGGALQNLIGLYVQVVLAQMMYASACNAVHTVEQRCCRWLLMTHDRIRANKFHLSHEFLSVMLGVRRQTVTVVAGSLQRAGLISYRHGVVTIRNRAGLAKGACECYRAIRTQFDRLSS